MTFLALKNQNNCNVYKGIIFALNLNDVRKLVLVSGWFLTTSKDVWSSVILFTVSPIGRICIVLAYLCCYHKIPEIR
jgi:hypothetical protein